MCRWKRLHPTRSCPGNDLLRTDIDAVALVAWRRGSSFEVMVMRLATMRILTLLMLPGFVLGAASAAALLEGKQLTAALAGGGYVILMRHASSPGTAPTAEQAAP